MSRQPRSRSLSATLALVVGLGMATSAAAQQKLGIFDAARVSEETHEGKQVQARLEGFRSAKQAEIVGLEQRLGDMQNQLTAQALSLSAEKRAELEKAIQRKALEVNQKREGATREMQIEIAEAQDQFQEKLLAVIRGFGDDEEFSLILEMSLVAYADQSADVTTAIVDRFNRQFPGAAAPASEPTGGSD
jgi:Skp family chaperone for outer membrane proteins